MLTSTSWKRKRCLEGLLKQRCELTPVKTIDSLCSETAASISVYIRTLNYFKSEILAGQTTLQASLDSCLVKLDANSVILAKQDALISNQQKIIESLLAENETLKKKLCDVTVKLDDLEQNGQKNTVELHRTVILLPLALPPVIVKFVRRTDTHAMLEGRKQVKDLSTRHIGLEGEQRQIYINLSLTARRRRLFAEARNLQRQFGYKYVWVDRSGTIKIRIVPQGQIYSINSEDDLKSVPTTSKC